MQIKKTVEVAHPLDTVWRALCDIELVAACLPGASITEALGGDKYKGRFQVKVGPLAAAFAGEVEIARDEAVHSATVSGRGADAKSSSRASGSLAYRLEPAGAAAAGVGGGSPGGLSGGVGAVGKGGGMEEDAHPL